MSLTPQVRRDLVFLGLAGFFVTNALLGELTGGKLIQLGPFALSIGVIPWPVVFLSTDLVNEYFGVNGVRRLTFLTMFLILYTFLLLLLTIKVPAASFSPVSDAQFQAVFGQSLWIILGSVTAFLVSQLVDVAVFWFFRKKTKGRYLWLRATGSTAISQFVDSFVVMGIAFWLPGKVSTLTFLTVASTNYFFKLLVAIGLTPLIYLVHGLIDRFLGKELSEELVEAATKVRLSSKIKN